MNAFVLVDGKIEQTTSLEAVRAAPIDSSPTI